MAWKISQSSNCDQLYLAPGNAGTETVGRNLDGIGSDFEMIKKAVLDNNIDLVIVGPEAPLVDGIVDFFLGDKDLQDVNILGPDKKAAQLEGSKSFAKSFMEKYEIPTAQYLEVGPSNLEEGYAFLDKMKPPYVLKADGLAAGKGVLILDDIAEARKELGLMLKGKFGDASEKVVIEEFLDGIEFSVFALVDGKDFIILPEAKDYKRIGEGDTGLNTGGMGSVSPVPFYDSVLKEKVQSQIIEPTVKGIIEEKMLYRGFIFFGLINVDGEPKVIEYNCRMGDPETQSVFVRLENDLLEVCDKASKGELEGMESRFSPDTVCTIVAVSGGYPGGYEKGKKIDGLDNIEELVFHAGTKRSGEEIQTNGGRVLAVTAKGKTIDEARNSALREIEKIKFEGINYRRDIGVDLL